MKRIIFASLAALAAGALLGPAPASAFIVDLTSVAATGTINGMFFQQINPQSTGTGILDPFVRIQNNGTEKGFNTDAPVGAGDLADVKPGTWTHSLLVSDFGVFDLNGTPTVRLMLDINQTGGNSLLSMDELRIFTADSPTISTYANLASTGTLVYDMDSGGDNGVLMDAGLNSGSGSGDLMAYLPTSVLAGHQNQYFYLFSKFGGTNASNDGFEEWARISASSTAPVPEPATLLLLGGGLLGGAAASRRRKQRTAQA